MRGRPFVLLGVNSDPDRVRARQESARRGLDWRSWWDGEVHGPVAVAWQMPGLPFMTLIDHTGVIRHRAVAGLERDRAVDRLVGAVPRTAPEGDPANNQPTTTEKP